MARLKVSDSKTSASYEINSKPENQTDTGREKMQTFFSWESAERIWYPKDRLWYLSYAALIVGLMVLMAVLNYWIVTLGLMAFLIMWFLQGTIPPQLLKHRITAFSLISNDQVVRWQDLDFFWFSLKEGYLMLHLDFIDSLQKPRTTLLANLSDQDILFDLLIENVKYATKTESGFNIFARALYGTYVPVTNFLDSENE